LVEEKPNPDILLFNACSRNSNMLGNVLRRKEGISFDVYDTLETSSLRPEGSQSRLFMEGSPVSVQYGKIRLMGTIVTFRGHEMYDVRYAVDGKIEPGVGVHRYIHIY
jgi:hypothetical protein